MIEYTDYTPSSFVTAVINGERVTLDKTAIHTIAVNAMALAVAMPSSDGTEIATRTAAAVC
jgi:hypothetical protein